MRKELSIDITNCRFVALEAPISGIATASLIHPSTYFNEVLYSSVQSNLTYCIDIASFSNVSEQTAKDAIASPNTLLYRVKPDGLIASVDKESGDLQVPFVDMSEREQNEKTKAIMDILFHKRKVRFFVIVAVAAFVLTWAVAAIGVELTRDSPSLNFVALLSLLLFNIFVVVETYCGAGLLIHFARWFLGKLRG